MKLTFFINFIQIENLRIHINFNLECIARIDQQKNNTRKR